MSVHRFYGEGEGSTDLVTLVPAPGPSPTPGSFVACPLPFVAPGGLSVGFVQEVYRMAYEQAVAVSRPPRHERLFLASSN